MTTKFNIAKLLNPECFHHTVMRIKLIETHISWVILTGEFAYKIKKPVNFGFLDFSTLEKRRECCEQELRLNRRLAPELYLDVVAVTGTVDCPTISGTGDIIEYAVKMLEFPQSAQLDQLLAAGKLGFEHMDAVAHMVAQFHRTIAVAASASVYGDSAVVYQPVEENFLQIRQHLDTAPYDATLKLLQQWNKSEFARLEFVFTQRKRDGFVRECHGDMHLRNMLWLRPSPGNEPGGRPLAFDCIEFNSQLRWIDVISEIAFLVMDLQDRQQTRLANRFLNTYLEDSGDYEGLSVLPFYLCYRAMVRAKVDALRLEQQNTVIAEQQLLRDEFVSYLRLATTYTRRRKPRLILMRGLSASGKSTVSQQLVDRLGAVRIRSDVERKRLFNVAAGNEMSNVIAAGIYSAQASQRTYTRLARLATATVTAGYDVIVDAAFLEYAQRKEFLLLASRLDIPCLIIEVTAPAAELRKRIVARKKDVSDADLSVLEHQLTKWHALDASELGYAISVNTARAVDMDSLVEQITAR